MLKILDFPLSTHDVALMTSKVFKEYETLYTVIKNKRVIDTNSYFWKYAPNTSTMLSCICFREEHI